MIISYQWLLEYLPEPLPVSELSKILTSIGLEVESIEASETIKGGLEGLVIGQILTCAKHPNADKLSVTTVNIGNGDPLHIVCGAPNVAAGQKVIIAPSGTTVHPTDGAPFLIKKARIRGEESNGMICAEDEIGLGKSHEGLLVLPADAPIGMSAKEYFKLPPADYSIHIGLTPNRSDANSHIGVARDVCAYLTHHGEKKYMVRMPVAEITSSTATPLVSVKILAPEACPRYAGISLREIRVGPSPEWLKLRLQAIGLRSINNVVDITNYVLHEYGQPLHAFDSDKISGSELNVRFMPENTVFTGLDEKERKLLATDLMICDAVGPLAMGGVFGGLHSGISDVTTNVFIESAYFSPVYIRRSSLHHGLRTDAATHFEKGVDINSVIPALKRAASLLVEIAGAKIFTPVTDIYPSGLTNTEVTVTYSYIRKLTGKSYHKIALQELLVAAGFEIVRETDESLTLNVPSNKTDVSEPADIVEEILRIDGLDNVEIPTRLDIALIKTKPDDRSTRERIAELLCGAGLQEIVTNSIVNSKYYPGREDLVRMINSLSSELDILRPSMLEGGLEVIQYNCNRKNQDLALFEFGNVYLLGTGRYVQESRLGLWFSGNVRGENWDQKPLKANMYYLRSVVTNLLSYCGIHNVAISYTNYMITWTWKKQTLCTAHQVPKTKLHEFDIKQDVFYADISWDTWYKASTESKVTYREVPRFPAVHRDLAIVIDNNVSYRQIEETTEQLNIGALQSFGLFDVFENEKLGKGKKSYALSYTFQLQDRTLTDKEIEELMKQLMDVYQNKLSAQIRQ